CFFARLQESLGTTLGWAEEPKGIRDPPCLILRYRRRIVRLREHEAGLLQPAKIRGAGVVEEGLTGSEPAPHPSRSDARIGAEAKRHHEHYREIGQRAAGPRRSNFQMTTRGTHA